MKKKILLTGATGYVGGLLLERLISEGYEVHVLARSPDKIMKRTGVEGFKGDIRDREAVASAVKGCDVAFYLVHGLNSHTDFEYEEALSAQSFASAANRSSLSKIIYLGGLGGEDALSPHLRSRHLTGKILALGKTPVTEFRASIVLGKNSTSYGIMKLLVQRLPFLVDPLNLRSLCQPIAEEDLIQYLFLEIERESTESQIIEIGGTDRTTYSGLLLRLALHSGIQRPLIPVPEIDPRILAEAFELVCPEYARVGRHLLESLSYPTVQNEMESAKQLFPAIHPLGITEALDRIGTFSSSPRDLIAPAHLARILASFADRFPALALGLPKPLRAILGI